jgi:hypothetical protein
MGEPTLKDLLDVARVHDATIQSRNVKIGRAIQEAAHQEVTLPTFDNDKPLNLAIELDPFGGNRNNRKVAARIASEGKRRFLNNSTPTHTGDPAKAAADLKLSLQLNPEPEILSSDDDVLTQVTPAKPSPGSPAALKQFKG